MASERPGDDTPSRDAERDERGDRDVTETDSQPANTPTQSPWWSAPAGRPVAIPAFGRSLLEALLEWLAPKPVLVPVKVRNARRRV